MAVVESTISIAVSTTVENTFRQQQHY